jgi:hypothetical protein
MVDTIQQIQKAQITNEGYFMSMDGWNTIWHGIPSITPPLKIPKPKKFVVSHCKLISKKEIF